MTENPYLPPIDEPPREVAAKWSIWRALILVVTALTTVAVWFVSFLGIIWLMIGLGYRQPDFAIPAEMIVVGMGTAAGIPAWVCFLAGLRLSRR